MLLTSVQHDLGQKNSDSQNVRKKMFFFNHIMYILRKADVVQLSYDRYILRQLRLGTISKVPQLPLKLSFFWCTSPITNGYNLLFLSLKLIRFEDSKVLQLLRQRSIWNAVTFLRSSYSKPLGNYSCAKVFSPRSKMQTKTFDVSVKTLPTCKKMKS